MIVDIYQTVEYRPQSPFRGWAVLAKKDCWLGQGYYFWEVFIKNAHRWGETSYIRYHKRYEIFHYQYDNSSPECLDLLNIIQRKQFDEDLEEVMKSCDETPVCVGVMIELIRKVFPEEYSKYECVRDWPQNGLGSKIIPYNVTEDGENQGRYYFNIPIQVCFWSKQHRGMKSVFVSK